MVAPEPAREAAALVPNLVVGEAEEAEANSIGRVCHFLWVHIPMRAAKQYISPAEKPPLTRCAEHHSYGSDRRRDLAGGPQFASLRIDLELHDIVGLLVGDVEPSPARVNDEIARKVYTLACETDDGELPVGGVDPIADDALRTTVGAVEKPARRMYRDLGKHCDRRVQLVDHIKHLAVV